MLRREIMQGGGWGSGWWLGSRASRGVQSVGSKEVDVGARGLVWLEPRAGGGLGGAQRARSRGARHLTQVCRHPCGGPLEREHRPKHVCGGRGGSGRALEEMMVAMGR